ncbi:MAG TPA: MFS transporter [Bryobacteraceae bacterium]|nr:MFS transporter [Bryobacteraceae bacterium]
MKHFSAWIPALSMMAVSLISYIDRTTLALLAPTILKETHLNAEEYGWIISAFSVAYMIGNPVWGRLLDRVGVGVGMAAAVGFWTLASVSHAFAIGFWSFALARAALGFGEGATFPGGLRTIMQTLDVRLRSRGIAVAYSGGSLGAVVTPVIVTPIALLWGWRGAFWFTGLVGMAWLTWWYFVSRREDIRQRRMAADAGLAHPGFLDRRLWGFMAVYALGGLPLAFVLYTASLYLGQSMGLSQASIGKLLWIPPLGWEAGYFFWGWQADRAGLRSGGSMTAFRRFFLLLMVLSIPLAFGVHLRSVWLLMGLLFFAMFVAAGFVIIGVAYATSIYSSDHAGFLAGLGAGSWSAVVALLMPWFGHFFDQRDYNRAFTLAAAFPVLGWAAWMLLNASNKNLKRTAIRLRPALRDPG